MVDLHAHSQIAPVIEATTHVKKFGLKINYNGTIII